MNFYSHHLGDYAAATRHLSMLEHGAYRLLLDTYYTRETALPADEAMVCRLAGARSEEERQAVVTVLREFFTLTDDGWAHARCDAEIERMREKSDKARQSVAQRKDRATNEERPINERSTNVDRTNIERSTPNSQEPITNSQGKEKKAPPAAAPRPLDVPEQVWQDWQRVRTAKRGGAVTETALAGIRREAERAGLSLADALAVCCERSWVGFRADWYADKGPQQARASPPSKQSANALAVAVLTGAIRSTPEPFTIDD